MKLRSILIPWIMVFTLAHADDIDAAIIESLDFYQNLELLENFEIAEELETRADSTSEEEPPKLPPLPSPTKKPGAVAPQQKKERS